MQAEGVLVRFGEIGIKSPPVRRAMVERLRLNLLDSMLRRSAEGDVRQVGARLWMVGPDIPALLDAAIHTFGVVSASPAVKVKATMEEMSRAAVEQSLPASPVAKWTSFAVRSTREGDHSFTSQEIGVQVGSAVFKAAVAAGQTPKVDLGSPDFEVHVDVRQDRAYVFTQFLAGPGGIPMGAQGRVVALLSDRASIVAAWLVMRRGCDVVPLHAGDRPVDGLDALAAWGLPDVKPIPAGAKRALLESAARLARGHGATAIVTGETLDSVLMSAEIPILRPVCGLDPDEVRRFGTIIGRGRSA